MTGASFFYFHQNMLDMEANVLEFPLFTSVVVMSGDIQEGYLDGVGREYTVTITILDVGLVTEILKCLNID